MAWARSHPVGVAQATALLFQCEECEHTRAGDAASRQVMAVQARRLTSIGNRVEVKREPRGLGEQHRTHCSDPAREQGLLLLTAGTIRIVGGEGLFGENIESREETESFIEVEVADVASSLLVKQF